MIVAGKSVFGDCNGFYRSGLDGAVRREDGKGQEL